ncbi:alpha-L-rhamnosidase-related protein [Salinimicrobium soli]|uniref:alpha-L-rhamnosidase-related protein n=1 Tax=Salinimicrobium soli TaxID=1254399 RepID=UPI003AAD674B
MKFNKLYLLPILALAVNSCAVEPKDNEEPLFRNDKFTVYKDKVVQGDNVAKVISTEEIRSNYKSPASANYSNLISFKFTINEKDNEMPTGRDHHVKISANEHESPIFVFGKADAQTPEDTGEKLKPNHDYTFRADMRPVLEEFEKKGFYEAFDGSRIAKQDFKGFYIAGGSEPLSWDFVNLEEKGLEMTDPDGDGIYEITLNMNPYDASEAEEKSWKLSEDISKKPSYSSDQPIVDALFKLSTEEALKNIEPDSTLRTGAEWGGVWTRDISYSIYLAFAYHEPEIAKISLMKKVNRDRIIQDTGSGGAWPISSDRTVWAIAAWEVYKVTGDEEWLRNSYEIIKNTLEDDYKTIRTENGLYKGESSFLDWREQTYPKWMNNVDILESQNLGTNVVHYQAHIVLGKMAEAIGETGEKYFERAESIKNAINKQLWQEDKGYYAQYLYGRKAMNLSERFEALGESLAVIFDVADVKRSKRIISESPVTPFGVTSIYPQIPGIPPYHNNGIWPFVQSYWNLAAAKAGNQQVLNQGLAAIYRPAALFLSNYENFVAESGDFKGTEINSNRMLWSMAGNLAMVHRLFIGMQFEENGIKFQPVIPKQYGGTKTLSNFPYRDATLDITVKGYGNEIAEITLDGKPLENAFFDTSLSGAHKIDIKMANNDFEGADASFVENKFSLPTPQAKLEYGIFSWNKIEGAQNYLVYKNGKVIEETSENSVNVSPSGFAEYKVSAIGPNGFESFTSEPIWSYDTSAAKQLEMESFTGKSSEDFVNHSGSGFIEISTEKNREVSLPVTIEKAGKYLVDFRYSNGSGPWNTDNKAAIRSLYVNDDYVGAVVFPQRGQDEWSDWGYSSSFTVELQKGENMLQLKFEDWNNNMNVKVNKAMLDYLRLILLE